MTLWLTVSNAAVRSTATQTVRSVGMDHKLLRHCLVAPDMHFYFIKYEGDLLPGTMVHMSDSLSDVSLWCSLITKVPQMIVHNGNRWVRQSCEGDNLSST